MGFEQLVVILRARARLIACVTLAALTLAMVITLLWPMRYEATASVVLDPRSDLPVTGISNMSSSTGADLVSTHSELLKSPNVALKVIDALNLEQRPDDWHLIAAPSPLNRMRSAVERLFMGSSGPPESMKDLLAIWLLGNVTVSTGRDSRLIKVTYASPNPKFSAAVANAFVRAYHETLLQLRTSPAKHNTQWFEDQLRELKTKFEQAEAKVFKFQQEKGIVASEERLDVENARLADLSTQLAMAQTQGFDSSAKQQQLRDYLRKGGTDAPTEVLVSPGVIQRQNQLALAEARLNELSQRLGRNHPDLRTAESEVQRARGRVKDEMRVAAEGLMGGGTVAPHRESQLRGALEEQRNKVLKLRKDRAELAILLQESDNARKAFDAAAQRFSQVRLEGLVDQTAVSAVVDSATPPLWPAAPKTFLNLAVGLFGGLVLGIGIALFLETVNRYVRSEADIVDIVGVPVLAVLMPKLSARQNVLRLTASNVYRLGR
jgi:succinoglycan biosynthesis transport protein ExoP